RLFSLTAGGRQRQSSSSTSKNSSSDATPVQNITNIYIQENRRTFPVAHQLSHGIGFAETFDCSTKTSKLKPTIAFSGSEEEEEEEYFLSAEEDDELDC